MLTREQIRKKLLENPEWEPEGDLTHEEWKQFDEVYDSLEEAGELKKKTKATADNDGSEDDDDISWDKDDEEEEEWEEDFEDDDDDWN